jgi:hypothetical protein
MNQKTADINDEYVNQFKTGFNQYMQLVDAYPYESLNKFRQMMWRLGMLVEIWGVLDSRQKETENGRIREK